MNQETLDLLVAFSRTQPSFFAIDEAARALHLGYSTTHRYLSYLEQSGVLHVRYSYGKQGRPRKEYRLVSAEPSPQVTGAVPEYRLWSDRLY